MRHACNIINDTPNMQDHMKRSPNQLFYKTKVGFNTKHYQTFGCPVHVLNNKLQVNDPYHKWKERSKVGIYLGMSPTHGKGVALVLDRDTGLVSPQFHVKFDPLFHTTEQDKLKSNWQLKTGFTDKPQCAQVPQNSEGVKSQTQNKDSDKSKDLHKTGKRPFMLQPKSNKNSSSVTNMRKRLKPSTVLRQTKTSLKTNYGSINKVKLMESSDARQDDKILQPDPITAMIAEIGRTTSDDIEGEIMCLEAMFPDNAQQLQMMRMDNDPLYAYKAVADPDTMYLHQAMKEPDWMEFREAMIKEVNDQMENGNFTIIKRSKVPKGKTILPAVWQMKRKRDIKTRKVKKYKARLNLDGSRQIKGVH